MAVVKGRMGRRLRRERLRAMREETMVMGGMDDGVTSGRARKEEGGERKQ